MAPDGTQSVPKVFVSYSWDSEQHRKWVIEFCSNLRKDGVDVILDHWHLQPGGDKTVFMEQSVAQSDRVLLVCTPNYAKKADERSGGVGYEAMIITSELAGRIHAEKFIPVLREEDWKSASPIWLRSKIGVNLTGDPYSAAEYERLIRVLHGMPEQPPPIGPVPRFGNLGTTLAAQPSDLPWATHIDEVLQENIGIGSVSPGGPFVLHEDVLEQGFRTILHHGYGDFFPCPPEWDIVRANWTALKSILAKIDLREYQPFRPTRAFAPKSKINLRPVMLLHPVDLILYTSLVSQLIDVIDDRRIDETENRVFSFRYSGADDELYSSEPSHAEFEEEKSERARRSSDGWMGFADIADFYSQLRHRPFAKR
jgi:hypothetical protein